LSLDKVTTQNKDTEKNAEEVKQVILRVYEAFKELDAEKSDANFSHSQDLLAFGTEWDEKFVGWNAYKDVHPNQFDVLKWFRCTTRELCVHVQDGVAWISDRPRWEMETKDGKLISNDLRITAVLRKEGGDIENSWRIVQWHVSVGL
jgi:ketosteroid isomerase-like protein